jgi:excisionase family DNA binding protein
MVVIDEDTLKALMRDVFREEMGAAKPAELMSTDEVAKLLSVTPTTVRNWIKQEGLPAPLVGNVRRIRRAELERFLDERSGKRGTSPTRLTAQVKRLKGR